MWWCMGESPTKNVYPPEENNNITVHTHGFDIFNGSLLLSNQSIADFIALLILFIISFSLLPVAVIAISWVHKKVSPSSITVGRLVM